MAYKNKLFQSLDAARDANASSEANDLAALMSNPEYLRHSSAIIHEALKDGFDVLQLPNGDIVTTGTKIITNTYVWDASKGAMGKARTPAPKSSRSRKAKAHASSDDSEE